MTTSQERLQQLFEAALKDSSDTNKPPTRRVPTPATPAAPAAPPVLVVAEEPSEVKPLPNAGLDDASSRELGALFDERQDRLARQRRRSRLITGAVMLALVGGGSGWFVQSPQRIQALKESISELRSVGDVGSMAESYSASLDRIATRGQQLDEATKAMGVDPSSVTGEDSQFEAEMQSMTGGEGKAIGQRNKKFQQAFSSVAEKSGVESGVDSAR